MRNETLLLGKITLKHLFTFHSYARSATNRQRHDQRNTNVSHFTHTREVQQSVARDGRISCKLTFHSYARSATRNKHTAAQTLSSHFTHMREVQPWARSEVTNIDVHISHICVKYNNTIKWMRRYIIIHISHICVKYNRNILCLLFQFAHILW